MLASALAVMLAAPAQAQDWYPTGSLNGTGLWDCHLCDVLGVRNIQGGEAEDPNLSIGAGSTETPGTIDFQYDVGTGRVLFFNGRKQRIFVLGPRKAVFYVPVVFREDTFSR